MCNLTLEATKLMRLKLEKKKKRKLLKTSSEHKTKDNQTRTLENDLARADDDGFALPEKNKGVNAK